MLKLLTSFQGNPAWRVLLIELLLLRQELQLLRSFLEPARLYVLVVDLLPEEESVQGLEVTNHHVVVHGLEGAVPGGE